MPLLLAAACSGRDAEANVSHTSSTPTPSVASADVSDRLFALGDAWLHTTAEMTYRTVARVLGQPVTAHLCLRQMYDVNINRTDLLRTCSRRGRLVLSWHPPRRWRMDVTTPVDRFVVQSTAHLGEICRGARGGRRVCRRISEARAIEASGFAAVFQSPDQVLDEIDATAVTTTEPSEALEGVSVECFAANGPEIHVEWCYSPDGRLLSFLRGSGSRGWESLEATTVS